MSYYPFERWSKPIHFHSARRSLVGKSGAVVERRESSLSQSLFPYFRMSDSGSMPQVVAFIVSWFDHNAGLARKFRLNHFADNTLEMINLRNNQTFLTRSYFPDLQRSQLFIGASITINSRQLHVDEYADKGTATTYSKMAVRTFGLVKPEGLASLGSILKSAPFAITSVKMVALDSAGAARFGCAAAGSAVAFEAPVIGVSGAAEQFMAFVDANSAVLVGAVSTTPDMCADAAYAFGLPSAGLRPGGECTACLIKPHAVTEGKFADIISEITASGFTIEALESIHFDMTTATSFFEVYKGVFSCYAELVSQMVESPSIFLKLSGGPGVVEDFREFCGPQDVEVAKVLRPKSLRAQFGADRVRNAVHCTDLAADGGLECSYLQHLTSI